MRLFEDIYSENYSTETENTGIESVMETRSPMLFEDIYFECNVKPLFEQVLEEAEIETEENKESEIKSEKLIYIEDLVKMTKVLSTKKPEIITHESFGKVYIFLGEASEHSYGLRHIIHDRLYENRNNDEISSILALVCSAIHNGIITSSYDNRTIFTKNGISAIISKLDSERGRIGLLTGYDLNIKKKEATGAIQTVIAQYSSAPEYSEFRKQVVAVTSNI